MTEPTPRRRKRAGQQRKLAECVFKKGFVTEQVDPLVDELWKVTFGGKTPFGDLRNQWRRMPRCFPHPSQSHPLRGGS